MRTRRTLAVLVASAAAFAALAAIPAAGASPAPTARFVSEDYCLGDWKYNGWPKNYCVIKQDQAHVWVNFTNSTDREVRYWTMSGDNIDWFRSNVVAPGAKFRVWGYSNAGSDIVGYVAWCPTKKYTSNCEGELRADVKWKNPAIGWPWMQVNGDKHGFRAMERYTYEEAYGHAGDKGVAKFKAQRLTDMETGNNPKRFEVDFTLAAPPAS